MPAWNHAGTEIAYNAGSNGSGGDARLYVVSTAGVSSPVLPKMPAELRSAFFPRFSPDGQWIYFTGDTPYPNDPQGYWTSMTTWRVRRDGTGLERLLPTDPANIYETAWEPDATPDGTALILAYAAMISRYDLATRTMTSLGVEGEMPRLSPAGDQIAYFLLEPGLISPIYLVRADGSGVRVLTPDHKYDRFAGYGWTPDGQWLVARGKAGLELVRVSTGEIIPLPNTGAMSQPAFRP
jgi:Tol biopolymer transport system component